MKRCIRCNYRARTLYRLENVADEFYKKQYICRVEFRAECDAKAKRVREKNNQRAS